MAKIVVTCVDPNDLEAVEQAAEQMHGRCNVTYFKQAEAMVEAGTAKNEYQAEQRIADETGESLGAVHRRVQRGKKIVRGAQPRAGRSAQSKFSRPTIKKNSTPKEDIFTPEFKETWNAFFVALKNAKSLGWKDVSREAALKYLAVLYDLLTY